MVEVKHGKLIKKGAEAHLYCTEWYGRKAIIKQRRPKKYRQRILDEKIRVYRTVHEPQLIHEARKAGVPTPLIYLVDVKNSKIVMEYVVGRQVKQFLAEANQSERKSLCFKIGELVGRLHRHGLVHGDLTTSNMILDVEEKVVFVDFGLGDKSEEVEAQAVDLHLMKRALQSTHFQFADECFDVVMQGYSAVVGIKLARMVLDKIAEIERRGRYVTRRQA